MSRPERGQDWPAVPARALGADFGEERGVLPWRAGPAGQAGGSAAGGACSLAHKCKGGAADPQSAALAPGEVVCWVENAGGLTRVCGRMGKPPAAEPGPRGKRGVIRLWSLQSRLRAYWAIVALPWPTMLGGVDCLFLTLTYPADYPRDGRQWQAHLREFRRRLGSWGFTAGVWKREHQRRGAPHFHIWAVAPIPSWERPDGWLRAFREWVSREWFEVVGSGDAKHLLAGTQAKLLPPGQSAVGYFKAYLCKPGEGKEYQHKLPDDVERAGRWWGVWGRPAGFFPHWRRRKLSLEQFHQLRRTLRRYKSARGRRVRAECRAAAAGRGEALPPIQALFKRLPRLWTTGPLARLTLALSFSGEAASMTWALHQLGFP